MALVFFFSHLAAKKWDYCQSLVMFWSIVYIQRGYFVRKWWLLLLNCYCTYVLYNLVHYRNNILWHLLVGNSYFYLCFRKSFRTLKNMLSLLLLALEGVELVAAVSLVHALHKLRVDDEPLPLGLLLLLLLLPHFLRLSRLLLSIRLDKKLVT